MFYFVRIILILVGIIGAAIIVTMLATISLAFAIIVGLGLGLIVLSAVTTSILGGRIQNRGPIQNKNQNNSQKPDQKNSQNTRHKNRQGPRPNQPSARNTGRGPDKSKAKPITAKTITKPKSTKQD